VTNTQSASERFPEDDLPGTGLFFDDAPAPNPPGSAAAEPRPDETNGPEEPAGISALSTGGAALAGLDPAAVEKLLTKVALRRYTKRIEEAVDARLDDLDWSEVAAGIETRVAGHVAEASGVNTETGEISDDPSAAVPDTDGPDAVPEETEEPPEPAFRTVYDFYEGIYGPLYEHFDSRPGVLAQRGTTAIGWCRQWWNHESVMMRLTALWQGYEVAYAEGGGAVSTWMLDHADRHFDRIMAEGGPLSECRSDHGNQMVRYPTDPLPEGLNLDAATVPPAQPGTH
jgi:hypothetical protein